MAEKFAKETIVEGLGVSSGIGIGVAYVCETGALRIPEYRIRTSDVDQEQHRLREAILKARRQIGRIRTKAKQRAEATPELASKELIYLLDAYQQVLKDSRLVRGARERIATERVNAEAAVQAEMAVICDAFPDHAGSVSSGTDR